MFTPRFPSAVPIFPITPGTSRFRVSSKVPSSGASSSIPSSSSIRGEPSCATVPSTVSACPPFSAATSNVFGNPRSRRRVVSSTISPRAAAACDAFTKFTFSSSTEFSIPISTALRITCEPSSAGSPA